MTGTGTRRVLCLGRSSSCCGNSVQAEGLGGQGKRNEYASKILLIATLLSSSSIIITLEVFNAIYYKEDLWRKLGFTVQENDGSWCESINADRTRFIIEPANARSDYFYIILGCWMLCLGIRDFWVSLETRNSEIKEPNFVAGSSKGVKEEVELNVISSSPRSLLDEEAIVRTDIDQEPGNQVPINASEESDLIPEQWTEAISPLLQYPFITSVHGIFNVMHGLGSFFFHACECNGWFAGIADVAGMVTVSSFGFLFTPLHVYSATVSQKNQVSSYVRFILACIPPIGQSVIWLCVYFRVIKDPNQAVGVFLSLNIASVIGTWCYIRLCINKRHHPHRQHKLNIWLFLLALAFFLVGFTAWMLEVNGGWWCLRGRNKAVTWFQAHAVWHVSTCGAILLLYICYRTEKMWHNRKM